MSATDTKGTKPEAWYSVAAKLLWSMFRRTDMSKVKCGGLHGIQKGH